jgi:polyisoprenoid-binding protein YceI
MNDRRAGIDGPDTTLTFRWRAPKLTAAPRVQSAVMRKLTIVLLLFAVSAFAQEPPKFEPFPARIDLVGAEIFSVDRSHSHLGFTIGFLGMSKVRGTFNDYAMTILYDEVRPERSSVTVVINTDSIDTAMESRDKDLKAERFFDVAKHPHIRFRSTRIEPKGKDRWLVHGDLNIKGRTKPIAIPMQRTAERGPDKGWGNIRIGGAGSVTINRKDFDISGPEFWSAALADDVTIDIDILGNRPNYDRWSWMSREKPSIGEALWNTFEAEGAAAAAAKLRELKKTAADQYNFDPGQVGIAVNRLMQRRKAADALLILDAAIESWPDQAGFYARSGEAYAILGKREDAIRMYEKSRQINAEGTEAAEMLRRLTK